MFKSVMEFETLVVEVLKTIKANGDFLELESLYDTADIFEALNYCVENNLVEGYKTMRTASGRIVADAKQLTIVTIQGLKFIESFTGKETSVIAKNALSKANKADIKSKIAISISFFSLCVAILSNLDKIHSNIIKVLTYLNLLK